MITSTVSLLHMCALLLASSIHVTNAESPASLTYDNEELSTKGRDTELFFDNYILPRLVMQRRIEHILGDYLNEPLSPELPEKRSFKKRLAGLENLDFMTGVFSKLPMKTNAAFSDLQDLMRSRGRRR